MDSWINLSSITYVLAAVTRGVHSSSHLWLALILGVVLFIGSHQLSVVIISRVRCGMQSDNVDAFREFKRKDPDAITMRQWLEKLEYFGNCCAYCLESVETQRDRQLFLEHVTPERHGGRCIMENIVPACRRCNALKADKTLLQWLLRPSGSWTNGERSNRYPQTWGQLVLNRQTKIRIQVKKVKKTLHTVHYRYVQLAFWRKPAKSGNYVRGEAWHKARPHD